MGLFDRIKKAFSSEQKEETEKQEALVEDKEVLDSESATDNEEETVVSEDIADDGIEQKEEAQEESQEKATDEALDTPLEEIPPQEPDNSDASDDLVTIEEEQSDKQAEVIEELVEETAEDSEEAETETEIMDSAEPVQAEETVQEKYDKGLEKTRKSFGERMNELFARFRRVDEDFFEELEETLIGADVGFDTAIKLTDSLRQEVKLKNAKKPAQIQNVIIEKLVEIYEAEGVNENNKLNLQNDGLSVILFVGVNGTGKTTSIGKLANQYKNEGKKSFTSCSRYISCWRD